MTRLDPKRVLERYARARARRAAWEMHWQECYEFALPQRDSAVRAGRNGEKKTERLFDATAPDAVDQLAASLMAQLTPPWSSWFGFIPGPDADAALRQLMAADLERTTRVVQAHFDRSNFVVEMHQCYLDLVTAGTACLMFEEAAPGGDSAFRFTAVPMSQVVLEEGPSGRLDTTFRRSRLPVAHVLDRFPQAGGEHRLSQIAEQNRDATVAVVEAVVPEGHEYAYLALAEAEAAGDALVVLTKSLQAIPLTASGAAVKAVSFPEFVWIWNRTQGITTPNIHLRMSRWLYERWTNGDRELVLLAFRSSGKSTLTGLFCAWLLLQDANLRILVLAGDFPLAKKMVRNVRQLVEAHPLSQPLCSVRPEVWAADQFTVARPLELRDPSMLAKGISANITGLRADGQCFT